MKKKILHRAFALGTTALIAAASLAMFTGCTTSNNPEVTITYTFNGEDYEVDYRLSRIDAPRTVQHFIELADAGFYDGLVIHDYQSSALYTGGYRLVDANGDGDLDTLEEINYLETVQNLEREQGITFTQSVWQDEERTVPLYSVYGEFAANGVEQENGRELSAGAGSLVMYYTDKGSGNEQVCVQRVDGGADNDGEEYQMLGYKYNSATSLFYTFTGENVSNTSSYCVFGTAVNYTEQMTNGLLAAINEYIDTLDEDETFTTSLTNQKLNTYDPFRSIQTAGLTADFETPIDMPIIVKSVVVTKY